MRGISASMRPTENLAKWQTKGYQESTLDSIPTSERTLQNVVSSLGIEARY